MADRTVLEHQLRRQGVHSGNPWESHGVVLRSGLELRCRKPTCPPLGGPPGPRLTTNGSQAKKILATFYVLNAFFYAARDPSRDAD